MRILLAVGLAGLVGCVGQELPPARADAVPPSEGSVEALLPPPPLPERSSLPNTSPPVAQPRQAVLGPGVAIRIEVTGEQALSVPKARVSEDGRVFVPFLGSLPARGQTPTGFGSSLARLLVERGYLKQAQVHVDVLEASGRKVYILGRVRSPGAYDLPFDRDLTLTQVIALAGGLATHKQDLVADPSSIRLIREEGDARKSYRISFLDVVEGGALSADVVLQAGDVVYVPPKQELFIFGSVNRPGGFPLASGSRLAVDEALGLAGGLTESADPNRLLLVRRSLEGGQTYLIPSEPIARAQVEITSSDTIIAPPRSVSRIYVLGSVARQGGYLLEPDLTVTKALALAGGPTRIAAANSVRLIRVSDKGEKRAYSVPVADIIDSGDLSKDPVLEPGDLIWVPEGLF